MHLCKMMDISLIVAASENRVIGKNNELPWHLPNDLKFFKKNTLGKPIIMGRKTFESIGKPLPGRLNIVLSRTQEEPKGTQLFSGLEDALDYLKKQSIEEVCIIGGGQIFEKSMSLADVIYFTKIETIIPDGEVFFPEIDTNIWKLDWEEPHVADEKHAFNYTFQKWVRR